MMYFDKAHVISQYGVTPGGERHGEQIPQGFPKPHEFNGQEVWSEQDLAMWDKCLVMADIHACAEDARMNLEALIDLLHAL